MNIKLLLIYTLIFIFACSDSPQDNEVISFDSKTKSFDEVFTLQEEFDIASDLGDGVKLFGIDKIAEYGENDYIISDMFSSFLLRIHKNGELSEIIGQKGEGPGEFTFLFRFDIAADGKIFALDSRANAINVYSKSGFIKKGRLSFVHRTPLQVLVCPDGRLLVSAFRNLVDGSAMDNYVFLPFENHCYLNVYDHDFNLLFSYLNPDEKFRSSRGIFSRPQMSNFTPSAILDDKIISMNQDGLYKIYLSDCNGNILKTFSVQQQKFSEFDFNLIRELKFTNDKSNFDMEKKGEIIAGHSSPIAIHVSGNYVIITIMSPYENYFPQFNNSSKVKNYHFDLYKYKHDELIPVAGGIPTDKKIIGVSEDNTIYMTDAEYIEDRTSIIVQKYSIAL